MKTSVTDPGTAPVVRQLLSVAEQRARQQRAVRRTAWTVAGIATLIYVAFILSGVLGR